MCHETKSTNKSREINILIRTQEKLNKKLFRSTLSVVCNGTYIKEGLIGKYTIMCVCLRTRDRPHSQRTLDSDATASKPKQTSKNKIKQTRYILISHIVDKYEHK